MSQFNLTPEEDAIMLSALRSKAASYLATYGVFDSELEALIDKVEGQLPVFTPVVEATPVVEEPVVEEVTPKSKKSKTSDE
jgi:hypothetical protein